MNFFKNQFSQVKYGGLNILFKKIFKLFSIIYFVPAFFIVIFIRVISFFFIIRIGYILDSRLGHFAANTELYLCEKLHKINTPSTKYIDLFFYLDDKVCNKQLSKMWKSKLIILPQYILKPIFLINKLLPRYKTFEVGTNSQWDRDIRNLLIRTDPFLKLSIYELQLGNNILKNFGISVNDKYVCLNVRDDAYLNKFLPGDWDYHNHRNSDINTYLLAAEKLTELGYFVFRMGVIVNKKLVTNNPKIIDYPNSGYRSDFFDIFLGATCTFCISVGSGFDAVPIIFRRPTLYVNYVPLGYIHTFTKPFINLSKRYYSTNYKRELSMREIFELDLAFSPYNNYYKERGIEFIDNTPEEILDVCLEMHKILTSNIIYTAKQKELQNKFWSIFPLEHLDTIGVKLHGQNYSIFSTSFLEKNEKWLN